MRSWYYFHFFLPAHSIDRFFQRRFAWENKTILGVDEDELSENEDAAELEAPAKKRKRTLAKGRIAQGDDFWSRVDSWFKEKIELWGSDFSGVNWKMYVDLTFYLAFTSHFIHPVTLKNL